MSYANKQNIKHAANRARHARVKKRYIIKFGTRGSANTFALTGKQAARLGRAYKKDEVEQSRRCGKAVADYTEAH
jgi:hypothetical protein